MKLELPLGPKAVAMVADKLFEIVARKISTNCEAVDPEDLLREAMKESGYI